MMHAATLFALTSLLCPQEPASTTAIRHAAAMPEGTRFALSVADLRDRESETADRLRTSLATLRSTSQVRHWLAPLFEIARSEWKATDAQVLSWFDSGFSLGTTADSQIVFALSTDLEPATELPRSISLQVGDGFREAFLGRRGSTIIIGSDIGSTTDALDSIGSSTAGLAGTEAFRAFSDHVLVTESMEPLMTAFATGDGSDRRTSTAMLLTDDGGVARTTTLIDFGPDTNDSIGAGLLGSDGDEPIVGRFAITSAGPSVAMRIEAGDWVRAIRDGATWSRIVDTLCGTNRFEPLTGEQLADLDPFTPALGSFVSFTSTEVGPFFCLEVADTTRFAEALAKAGAESTDAALVTESGLHLRLVDGTLTIALSDEASTRSTALTQQELDAGRQFVESADARSQILVAGIESGLVEFCAMLPASFRGWLGELEPADSVCEAELRFDGRGTAIRRTGGTNPIFDLLLAATDRFEFESAATAAAEPATDTTITPENEAEWIARLREVEADGNDPEALAQLLDTESSLVNTRAAWLLAKNPDPVAIPALTQALRSDSEALRQHAMAALCGLGKNAPMRTMRDALEDDDVRVRALAAEFLGRHGQAVDAGRLFDLIDRTDTPGADRTAAILALVDRHAAKEIILAAGSISAPSHEEERALAFALQSTTPELAPDDELESLLDLLAHEGVLVRRYAIERLGQLADPRAVDSLERRLATENDSLRPKLEAALTASRGVEPMPALPDFANEENLIPLAAGGGAFLLAIFSIFLISRRRRRSVMSATPQSASAHDFDEDFDEDFDYEAEDDAEFDDEADEDLNDEEFWPEQDEEFEDADEDDAELDTQRR